VPKLSLKSELTTPFLYMRTRWTALSRCFEDGRLSLDDNPAAARALRGVTIRRKNYLFAGSDAGRRRAAIYSLIRTAKLIQPAGLSRRRPRADRRSPGQTRRRIAALELATRPIPSAPPPDPARTRQLPCAD
jgi:hypothetical protein